jgi:beta-fructofuranosidase
MTLPRRLTLVGKDDLRQEPAGDIESLRYNHQVVKPIKLAANKEVVFENIKGDAMEINLEIDPKKASMIELNVLRSPNKEEYTRIVFMGGKGMGPGRDYRFGQVARLQTDQPAGKTVQVTLAAPAYPESLITIESSYSSLDSNVQLRGPETASFSMKSDEPLKLRVFIDKSVVEVFVNGKQALAVRVYPSREDATGVSLRSQGQSSDLIMLEAWQMRSIYNTNINEISK